MFQKTIIFGNVGQDPEMRMMADGQAVTSLSVATNRQWKDRNSGQTVKETTWFRVSFYGALAGSIAQYVTKGMPVLIEGRLVPDKNTGSPRIWQNKAGEPRTGFDLRGEEIVWLRTNHDGTTDQVEIDAMGDDAQPSPASVSTESPVDDIPF